MTMRETKQTVITCPATGDSFIRIDHKSGLTIYVCEMNDFSTTEALFATKYGSINICFKTAADEDYCKVPDGIAHFLEHKFFENEDCDVLSLYAKTGAKANAFTSFDKTAYYFRCTDNFIDSLKILLSFVQNPYFTKESVEKELGIIGQEISMTNDNPSWRVFFNMLRGLYHKHPVKIDIAGTHESIAKITPELLYSCYNTFYNLHNMVLSVSGKCRTEDILKAADELLKPCEDIKLQTVFPEETLCAVRDVYTETAPVGAPIFNLGIKCRPRSGYDNLKAEMEAYIAMQLISNSSSPLYQSLMEEKLINNVFTSEVFNGDGFFCVIFDGESEKPEEVRSRIFAEIERVKKTGLDPELFEELRKSTYGSMIQEMNNVSAVANIMMNAHMSGVAPFDTIKVLSEMTLEDVNEFLRKEINTEHSTLSIVRNSSGDEEKGTAQK